MEPAAMHRWLACGLAGPLLLAGCTPAGPQGSGATGVTSARTLPTTSATSANPSPSGPQIPLATAVAGRARAYPPRVADVAVVGDSLTVGTQPFLSGEFASVGSHLDFVKAQVGIPTSLGLSYLRNAPVELPRTVIVALGTNDVTAEPADVVGWLEQARAIVGPDRRLVWVNLSMGNPEYPNDEVVNKVLAEAVARDPRLMVLDWQAYAADHGIANAVDGVHYSTEGYQQRAQFYTCAVVASPECAPYQLRGSEAVPSAPTPSTTVSASPTGATSG